MTTCTTINKWQIYCNDESDWISGWLEERPTVCFNNNTHSVNALSAQLLEDQATIGDTGANVNVTGSNALTPFGSLKVETYSPIIQYEFPYTINTDKILLGTTGSGTSYINNSMMTVQTGTTINSESLAQTRKRAKYRAGQGMVCRFTGIFTPGVTGTTQIIGIFDENDGFAFGYNGIHFSVLHRNSSSGSTIDTWVPQSQWSGDTADGLGGILPLMNFNKGNVFEISFQYLGMGMIRFKIENPSTGGYITVHEIVYANENTAPSLSQATLPFTMYTNNGSTTSDLILSSASVGIFNEGLPTKSSPLLNIVEVLVESLGSVETVFFSLRSRDLYGGIANRIETFIQELSVSSSSNGNRIINVNIYLNSVLSGTSWSFIDSDNRVTEQDFNGTITTQGELVFKASIANNTTQIYNLEKYNTILIRNDVITITGYTSNGQSDVSLSLSLLEDH